MDVITYNKNIHYYEKKPDSLTLKLMGFSPEDLNHHREFLEIDLLSQEQLILCQTGSLKEFSTTKARIAGGTISTWLKKHQIENICVDEESVQRLINANTFDAFFEGLFIGGYSFDKYKQNNSPSWKLNIHLHHNFLMKQEVLENIQKYTKAIDIARSIGNEPANIINPGSLAEKCVQVGGTVGLSVKVIDETQLSEIGAGGILSVGQGSMHKPRLIILEHFGNTPSQDPIVVVGKAITFDTGGYSLKSVEGMQGMKFDKLGGISVIGFMLAAALLNLPQHIIGIISAAENMVSEAAYRPDDVITTLSGKTVEILTTDAEGRLVLADGITYAQNNYRPKLLIDIATLTGGIVTALGNVRAGLFCNNETLSAQLLEAGEISAEKLWRMPLDDEYFDSIKGDYADLKNSGGRKGHPIMGAIFLKQFIQNNLPWAHIDIAGTASNDKPSGLNPKGANGFGIRLLLELIKQF